MTNFNQNLVKHYTSKEFNKLPLLLQRSSKPAVLATLIDSIACAFLHGKSDTHGVSRRGTKLRTHDQHRSESRPHHDSNKFCCCHFGATWPPVVNSNNFGFYYFNIMKNIPPYIMSHQSQTPRNSALWTQLRSLSTNANHKDTRDEDNYNDTTQASTSLSSRATSSLFHEWSTQLYQHLPEPLNRMLALGKVALDGHYLLHEQTPKDVRILDFGSPVSAISAHFPNANIISIIPTPEAEKLVNDNIKTFSLKNITPKVLSVDDLSQFEDGSFDLVTSYFGLQSSNDILKVVKETHRVLKPGGSMVSTAFEHLGSEPVIQLILKKVMSGQVLKGGNVFQLSKIREPHLLEEKIADSGMSVQDSFIEEYPIHVTQPSDSPGSAFEFVCLPIKNVLGSLVRSGQRPYAFEDARAAFDSIVSKGVLLHKDPKGCVVMEDNRFKFVVARRHYENGDRINKVKKHVFQRDVIGDAISAYHEDSKEITEKFDKFLTTSFKDKNNPSLKFLVESISKILKGHDVSHKVNLLDLSSRPDFPIISVAETFPQMTINSLSSSPEDLNKANSKIKEKQCRNINTNISNHINLSKFEDSSMDIITSSFGLGSFRFSPEVMKEIHRVLKPGGSLLTSTWDSISLESVATTILHRLTGEDKIAQIMDDMTFSEPHKLETLIEDSGLSILSTDHVEFPFVLSGDTLPEDYAYEAALIPIRPMLKRLVESGQNPLAFEDARRIFDEIVVENDLVLRRSDGELITTSNRIKNIIARRKFEDADGVLDKNAKKEEFI